ncbi:kelch repeat-containing protein [Cesiribacter sp. SM1]|uniref:Kelch repeat-containing protein n=1 Tax=Cesiribacter sp. SM1 TaxID=2861196 RepID=UPI001CD68CA1|nr:kelch repeat-containing protein [Cesiribacter sp. SM1]
MKFSLNQKTQLFGLLLLLMFQFSCESGTEVDSTSTTGDWTEMSDFEGNTRSNAVSFVIGNKAFVGTGYNGSTDEYLQDFWYYNLDLNYWVRVADFPGEARSSAVAFAINDKGYVGTGSNGSGQLSDFWEYDPATNTWTQKADFGGTARRGAVGFGIADKGYVGTGYDGSNTKDFWQYDPIIDTWTQVPSLGGSKRRNAVAFVIAGKAYVGTGTNNGVYQYDFWEFDPAKLTSEEFPWTAKTDLDEDDAYTAVGRESSVAFTIGSYGYITTGYTNAIVSTTWQYDPLNDTWNEMTSFEGASRMDAVGFSIMDRGFITTGRNSSTYFDDIWEFRPDLTYDENN